MWTHLSTPAGSVRTEMRHKHVITVIQFLPLGGRLQVPLQQPPIQGDSVCLAAAGPYACWAESCGLMRNFEDWGVVGESIEPGEPRESQNQSLSVIGSPLSARQAVHVVPRSRSQREKAVKHDWLQ